MNPNSSCLVLVPAFGLLSPKCEDGLRELESRGYPVRRVRGFSAIDQGRNQMASDAIHDGFAETMFIDPDIGFAADAVERVRSHGLPICAGIYPQPGARALACHLLPGAGEVVFGEDGGLMEILYAAAGFLHVRRAAYERVRDELKLPLCNTRFGRGMWPFFQSCAVDDLARGGREDLASGGRQPSEVEVQPTSPGAPRHRYLTEDFAFCHRARQAGLKIMADTSIRLWKAGSYNFGWEDAGGDPERFDTFQYRVE